MSQKSKTFQQIFDTIFAVGMFQGLKQNKYRISNMKVVTSIQSKLISLLKENFEKFVTSADKLSFHLKSKFYTAIINRVSRYPCECLIKLSLQWSQWDSNQRFLKALDPTFPLEQKTELKAANSTFQVVLQVVFNAIKELTKTKKLTNVNVMPTN